MIMANEPRTFDFPGQQDWHGLRCQDCNEPLRNVDRTERSAGFVVRVRVCAKCGCRNKTFERVVQAKERNESPTFR